MIGLCNCPITAKCPITTSENYLEQNAAVYAPVTFEEKVIVMITELKRT